MSLAHRLLILFTCLCAAAPSAPAADEASHLVGTARPDALLDSFTGALEHRVPLRKVARGPDVLPLPPGEPLPADFRDPHQGASRTIADYVARRPVTGLMVLKDGRVLHEQYARGQGPATRFLSASMAKSVVGLLVGIALHEGRIRSLDDLAREYVPDLAGNPYGETSLRNLLAMSSGVAFAERYDDADDLRRLLQDTIEHASPGGAAVLQRYTQRRVPAGAAFYYSSADTQALGLVLRGATGMSVAEYLGTRLWAPRGAEDDASYLVDAAGQEATFAFLHARLRDFARLGVLLADEGRGPGGRQVVPAQWVHEATRVSGPHTQPYIASAYYGYGLQFWVFPGSRGQFAMLGVRGQVVFVDPALKLVLVQTAVWPTPGDRDARTELLALWDALVARYASSTR
jgi:CubicO group peptidase (beta-lactamase class C family)